MPELGGISKGVHRLQGALSKSSLSEGDCSDPEHKDLEVRLEAAVKALERAHETIAQQLLKI